MTTIDVGRSVSARRVFYLCACVLLSALVFGVFMYRPGINGYNRAMFGDMVYGTAPKPFVYRMLLPTTVRLIAAAIPEDSRLRYGRSLASTAAGDNLCKILGWEEEYLVEYLIAGVLMYMSLWGFLWALRYLLQGLYQVSVHVQDLVVLFALAGLPLMFRYYSYLYDFPTLFLFTLGLALMTRTRWKLFVLVYVLACLNKETTILLTMIFVIHFLERTRIERKLFRGLLTIQLAIFVSAKAALFIVFRDNPGSFVEVHFGGHNLELLQECSPGSVVAWGVFALMLFYKWSGKPVFLRHALWIALPLVVSALFFGYLDELRDYYEVYPIVVLLLIHSAGGLVGFEVADLTASRNHRRAAVSRSS